jgi:GNAT superfamily N-acetyltransferase
MRDGFTIRDARLPDDMHVLVSFIDGLQHYEHRFEPNRRIDAQAGKDYFLVLLERVAEHQGRIFVAEADGQPIGWAVFLVEQDLIYVIEDERTYGYIAELFVKENVRGQGVGQALIKACEGEGRARGLKRMMIGVIPANERAAKVYAEAGYSPYAMELRKIL